jgi:hypothetical protein
MLINAGRKCGSVAGRPCLDYPDISKILRLDEVVVEAPDGDGIVHPLPKIPRGPHLRHRLRLSRC